VHASSRQTVLKRADRPIPPLPVPYALQRYARLFGRQYSLRPAAPALPLGVPGHITQADQVDELLAMHGAMLGPAAAPTEEGLDLPAPADTPDALVALVGSSLVAGGDAAALAESDSDPEVDINDDEVAMILAAAVEEARLEVGALSASCAPGGMRAKGGNLTRTPFVHPLLALTPARPGAAAVV